MAKTKKEVEVKGEVAEEAKEEVAETGSASVYRRSGKFVRTYTAEIHGADYKKLATVFAGKIHGSVK